jgi:acyl-CoA thioesterase-1
MVRLFSFFSFVIVLTSCAPKPESAQQPAPAVVETPKVEEADPRPVIVCFGDSLTAGYGLEPGQAYPDYLQKLLDDAGYKYRVVNLGISGDTTQGALDRIHTLVEYAPAISVIELGGNDGLRGIPVDRSRDNLMQIAVRAKKAGSKVVIAGITLPPNYGREYIALFEEMFRNTAKSSGDAFLPFVLEGVWNVKGYMQADGIHPTAAGAQQMAKNVFKTIQPLLQK